MKLGGLQKTSLIDYPGKIACTVFTIGCSFRCPFCHNPELVLPTFNQTGSILEKDFFNFLLTKKNKLDGVCITGGEPTVQVDIIEFIKKIKKIGLLVKLDSNGSRPDVLNQIIKLNLVDYFAMDIKNNLKKYSKTIGVKVDRERIKLSVELIKNSGKEYEFRTTVVPSLHTYEDFKDIAKWINNSKKYSLQNYQDKGKILQEEKREVFKNSRKLNLNKIKKILEKNFEEILIRE